MGYITSKGRYCNTLLPPLVFQPQLKEVENSMDKEMQFISVYPNPFTGVVTVESDPISIVGPVIISVYNSMGQNVISEKRQTPGKTTISLSGFPEGIYYIRVSTTSGTNTKKIVKKQD